VPARIDEPWPATGDPTAAARAAEVEPVPAGASGPALPWKLQALMMRRHLRFHGGHAEADFKPVAPRSPG
jgi:hypothetical protein